MRWNIWKVYSSKSRGKWKWQGADPSESDGVAVVPFLVPLLRRQETSGAGNSGHFCFNFCFGEITVNSIQLTEKKEVLSFDKSYRVIKGKNVKVEKEVKRRND